MLIDHSWPLAQDQDHKWWLDSEIQACHCLVISYVQVDNLIHECECAIFLFVIDNQNLKRTIL